MEELSKFHTFIGNDGKKHPIGVKNGFIWLGNQAMGIELSLIDTREGCLDAAFAWRHNAISLLRLIKENPQDYEVNERRKNSAEVYLWSAKKALRIAKARGYISEKKDK